VAEVFEAPLRFFSIRPTTRELRAVRRAERYYYAIPYQHYYIWGDRGMLMNLHAFLRG